MLIINVTSAHVKADLDKNVSNLLNEAGRLYVTTTIAGFNAIEFKNRGCLFIRFK
jgi:hypothetical protein